jgi:hypothetical protein
MKYADALAQYEAAQEAHKVAFAKFDAIRDQYRARQIPDAVYCAAAAEHKLALDAFDVAFAIMQDAEPEEVAQAESLQAELF